MKILILDDNKDYAISLKAILGEKYSVVTYDNIEDAQNWVKENPDLILSDIRLVDSDSTNTDGISFLENIKERDKNLPVILITGYPDINIAIEAMKKGADNFYQKSQDLRILMKMIDEALERRSLKERIVYLENELDKRDRFEIIGSGRWIEEIRESIEAVSKNGEISVLIIGQTGTGKELVARQVHRQGVRSKGPFVAINVAALNINTIESELFGHEKGAFTGADRAKEGLIESANGGILFLDEISEIDANIQVKLLRFLEEREIQRMGSTKTKGVDIQLICATNKELEKEVIDGKFRKDLFFRIRGEEIRLPALVSRPDDDLKILVEHFLTELQPKGRIVKSFDKDAIECCLKYDWPGNVRELRSVVDRAILSVLKANVTIVTRQYLPVEVRDRIMLFEEKRSLPDFQIPDGGIDLNEEVARYELHLMEKALVKSKNQITKACDLLGLSDRDMIRKKVQQFTSRFSISSTEFPELSKKYSKYFKQ